MKAPYAAATLRRKYKETGIENIEQIKAYLTACSNFYYILETDEAWVILKDKCGINKEEFNTLLSIMGRDEKLPFYIVPDKELYIDGTDDLLLVRKAFLRVDLEGEGIVEDWDRFFAMDGQRAGKRLYIPADILAYADGEYYEKTPQAQAMLDFILKIGSVQKDSKTKNSLAECVLVNMIDIINDITIPMSKVMEKAICNLEEYGFKRLSMSQLQQFAELFTNLSNHTRMPCNRGFTPDEMVMMSMKHATAKPRPLP